MIPYNPQSSFFRCLSYRCRLRDNCVLSFCHFPCPGYLNLLLYTYLFSFSSPAPSGFVSFPVSGLRSFYWLSLLYPPYPSWYMMVGKHQRRCLLFWHYPCFCFRLITYCRYGLPLSFSWRVSLYFSFAKLAQAVSGKYWSLDFPIPSEICRQPSAFSS